MKRRLKYRLDRLMKIYYRGMYDILQTWHEVQVAYDHWQRIYKRIWDPYWKWIDEIISDRLVKERLADLLIKQSTI